MKKIVALAFPLLLWGCWFISQPAQASDAWLWRLRPAPRRNYEMAVWQRQRHDTAKNMIQSSFANGQQTEKIVPRSWTDRNQMRVRFHLKTVRQQGGEQTLQFTFRELTASLDRDGWDESVEDDAFFPTPARDQMLRRKQQNRQKRRQKITDATLRFSRSLRGATFSCVVASDGRVLRFEGWAGYQKRLAAALQQAGEGEWRELTFAPILQAGNGAMARFGGEDMRDFVRNWLGGVPQTPVVEGESWNWKAKIPPLGFLTPPSILRRTLQKREAARVVVSETASVIFEPPTPTVEPNSVAYTTSFRGTHRAQIAVNASDGMPTRTARHLRLDGRNGVLDEQGANLHDEKWHLEINTDIALKPLP